MTAAQGWANLQELRRHGLDLIRSALRPQPRRTTIFAIRNGHMSFQMENSTSIKPIRALCRRPNYR